MDWEGIGLAEEVLNWLDITGRRKATRERRLDPFATSMRDFDDVAPNLRDIKDGRTVKHSDATQRVADLRSAALVDGTASNPHLTPLGIAVLDAWESFKVANIAKEDEAIRTLIVYGSARRLGVAPYTDYFSYWSELRATLATEDLIDNWDALFTLNYLDYRLDGFAPGDAYRDEGTPIDQVEYDLDLFATYMGAGAQAKKGAAQVQSGIEGKIPRGRARATACLVMELLMRDPADRISLVSRFGLPKRPRLWQPFSSSRSDVLLKAAAFFESSSSAPVKASAGTSKQPAATAPPGQTQKPEPIDFSTVLQPIPKPSKAVKAPPKKVPKKIDYRRRQERNSEVGALGEEIALEFERWRLRSKPALAAKVARVSLDDDTLGFDIQSFEIDGSSRLVEVKATEGPLTARFFVSASELAVGNSNLHSYLILRVGSVRTTPVCCEVRPPFDDLELTASVYQATFKSA